MKKLLFLVFTLSVSFAFSISAQELYKKWEKRLPWEDSLCTATFSPDDRYFIAGGPSKIYKLNTEDASIVWSMPFGGTKVVYANEGDKFYACNGLEFRIHDAQTGVVLGSYLKDLLSKDTLLTEIQGFVVSPDDSKAYIFASYKQYYMKPTTPDRYIVFDLQNNKILNDVQLNYITIEKVVISPDGKWFGMIINDGLFHIDPITSYVDSLIYNTGIQVWKEYPSENREIITDVTFSSDSKYFVYCGDGGVARYANMQNMKKEGYLDPPSGSKSLFALTFNNKNQFFLGGIIDFLGLTIWDFNKDKQMVGYYPDMGFGSKSEIKTTRFLPYLMIQNRGIFDLYDLDSTVSVPVNSELKNTDIIIFNDTLNIETGSLKATVFDIIISDLQGKQVFEQTFSRFENKIPLSLSKLPGGAYLCSVRSEKEILSSFKFLINR